MDSVCEYFCRISISMDIYRGLANRKMLWLGAPINMYTDAVMRT